MKIVADRAIPFVARLFGSLGDVHLVDGRTLGTGDLADADALIVRTVTRVNRQLLEGSAVRFVGSATSGHDHVDTDYLRQNNIHFASAPGCNARSVAEYVLSSLLVLAGQRDKALQDASVGIIGCGHVGSTVYGFLEALGLRCILHDPLLKLAGSRLPLRSLEEALAADIITLHVPLTVDGPAPTRRLLDADQMSRIRRDAVIINTSRGGVINEAALKNYMADATGSAVVLDVWENEPDIDAGLAATAAIATPHIAGYSLDAKLKGTTMIYRQACAFFGRVPDETMIPQLPRAEPDHIRIRSIEHPLDAIQLAVLSSYDVRTDSVALRLSRDDGMAGNALFSMLRNNYPVRREFPAMTVVLEGNAAAAAPVMRQLGFNVQ